MATHFVRITAFGTQKPATVWNKDKTYMMSLINDCANAIARLRPKRKMKNSAFPLLLPVRFVFITVTFSIRLCSVFFVLVLCLAWFPFMLCLAMHVPFYFEHSAFVSIHQFLLEIVWTSCFICTNAQTQMINERHIIMRKFIDLVATDSSIFSQKLLFLFQQRCVWVIFPFQWQTMRMYQFTVNLCS